MKWIMLSLLIMISFMMSSCSEGQTQSTDNKLSAVEFANKIKTTPLATVLDVRTPEEYNKGHLLNAVNYDWNGNDFKEKTATLGKSQTLFVYCLSGGRSADAIKQLRSDGFQNIYELKGGIMKWRAANLPLTDNSASISKGMSMAEYEALGKSDKMVLIDFYADWCGPCKRMKPYLDEFKQELANKLVVIRINADDNQDLCKSLNIDALPVLKLYKNSQLAWTNKGFISKEDVLKKMSL